MEGFIVLEHIFLFSSFGHWSQLTARINFSLGTNPEGNDNIHPQGKIILNVLYSLGRWEPEHSEL